MTDGSSANRAALPQLVYIGDVPIESSYHGSALIFRLLQRYPADRLVVIERSTSRSLPSRRLADVRYEELGSRIGRLLTTRVHRMAASWLVVNAKRLAGRIPSLIGDFSPEAVLTVAHGFSWLTASAFAERTRLPLHLIVHDDWPGMATLITPVRRWMEQRYGEVYRQAASRLCVSPQMVSEYERRYRAKGTLLYPSRARGVPEFDASDTEVRDDRPFSIAFAGSLNVGDYVRQLVELSWLLPKVGGRLLLFGPFEPELLAAKGANTEAIVFGGLLSSAELITRIHAEADVVFVPESFEQGNVMNLSFPSKLTDYTAAARPLLIWGPERSAAVDWAGKEPGLAAVVTNREPDAMARMLKKLAGDPIWRRQLSAVAAAVGKRYFAPERAQSILYDALATARK